MTRLTALLVATSFAALSACETAPVIDGADTTVAAEATEQTVENTAADVVEAVEDEVELVKSTVEAEAAELTAEAKLAAVLASQPDDVKARYVHRHPAETLTFFGIEPGMTVVEALPGGGWYTKILLPYVGPEGKVVGAQYPDGMWAKFRPDDADWQAQRIEATTNWALTASEWGIEDTASIDSYKMTTLGEAAEPMADAVLLIRTLHNLHRFNTETGWFDATLAETFQVLKPGGVVGVVQHRAPEANSDTWSDGNNGYLKQDAVIAAFEAAGFEFEASSEVNANPNDVPTEEDFVWRLPPTLATTEEGTPEREAVLAIGETDRMTLRFRKPA